MKAKRICVLIGIFILTLIPNYLIYRRVIYSYLAFIRSFYLFKFINTPYFVIAYLILGGVYFMTVFNQLLDKKIHKNLVTGSFLFYCLILIFILFYKSVGIRGYEWNVFKLIEYLRYDTTAALINISLFIPMGLFIKRLDVKTILLSIAMLFGIEAIQYIFSLGIFDLLDILLNFVGLLIGYQLRRFIKSQNIVIE